jgi:hypothetical protein
MIASAIETDSLTALLSSRLGKAKYYAFFNGTDIQIEENIAMSSLKVASWLAEKGVTDLLIKKSGIKPCALKPKLYISLHYPSAPHPTLQELIRIYYQIM